MGRFPPLYECSRCGAAVQVRGFGIGVEPEKTFTCGHDDAIIWANRRVTLRGVGSMSQAKAARVRVQVTLRQLLCWATGRSI